jgi:hypothetical protein
MKHELFSVWKNDGFNPKTPWSVQFPKGILSFKTKKKATAIAEEAKRIAATSGNANAETLITQEYVL